MFISKDQPTKSREYLSKPGCLVLEKESFVNIKDVQIVGEDVVIISNKKAVSPPPEDNQSSSLNTLKGFKITTQEGQHIGELYDLNIITEDGKIAEIILTENKRLNIRDDEITIGDDVIMVPVDYAKRIQEIEHARSGILTHLLTKATVSDAVKVSAKETFERAGATVKGTIEKMGGTVKETAQKVAKNGFGGDEKA
jgi:sporulation protein YlmC with PRC-barrel domain